MPKSSSSPNPSDTVLLLDASSSLIQVGLLQHNQWLAFHSSSEESLQALFAGVQACFDKAHKSMEDISAFAFCEGPGSLLGIRLASMAIKTWTALPSNSVTPIYSYNSFAVSHHLIQKFHKPQKDFKVISPFSKDTYLVAMDPQASDIEEVSSQNLSKLNSQLWYFSFKKLGAEVPPNSQTFEYNLEKIPEIFLSQNLLKHTQNPDALLLKQHDFVKWTGERHKPSLSKSGERHKHKIQ